MLKYRALLWAVAVALAGLVTTNANATIEGVQQIKPSTGQPGSPDRVERSEDEPKVTFRELDRNGDGELDEDELNTYGAPAARKLADETDRGARMLEQMDEDGSGGVSEEEFEEANLF